jgi:hypothetical protein
MTSGTAGLTTALFNVGASRELVSRLSARADVGAGVLVFSGLTEPGNPFLETGEAADGPLSMFQIRAALGVEYAVNKSFVMSAQPVVFSYSPTDPLRDDIEKITRFEVLVGAGYRM